MFAGNPGGISYLVASGPGGLQEIRPVMYANAGGSLTLAPNPYAQVRQTGPRDRAKSISALSKAGSTSRGYESVKSFGPAQAPNGLFGSAGDPQLSSQVL